MFGSIKLKHGALANKKIKTKQLQTKYLFSYKRVSIA